MYVTPRWGARGVPAVIAAFEITQEIARLKGDLDVCHYFGQKPVATGADFVGRTEEARQLSIIVPKFGKHLPGKKTPVVGIFDPSMTGDVPDTSQRISPNLGRPFGKSSVITKICPACSSSSRW